MLNKRIIISSLIFVVITLSVVVIAFNNNILSFPWIFSALFIALMYFILTASISKTLLKCEDRNYRKLLFRYSLISNLIVMVFMLFFNYAHTNTPFSVNAMDEIGYDTRANLIVDNLLIGHGVFKNIDYPLSDIGFPAILGFEYLVLGRSVFLSRLIQVVLGTLTVLFIYLLARNFFNEPIAKLTGVLLIIYPHLLYFHGVTLKETHMVFFLSAALYSASILMKQKFSLWHLFLLIITTTSLFFFRQPLAILVVISVLAGFIFTTAPKKRIGIILYALLFSLLVFGFARSTGLYYETYETVATSGEMHERVTEKRVNQSGSSQMRLIGLPVYVIAAIPTPFPSLVDTEKIDGFHKANWYHSGGSFVWNALSFFFIIGLFHLLRRHFFKYIMLIMFVVGYLIILSYSGYVTSLRYTVPAIPIQMIFVAVGIFLYKGRIQWYNVYLGLMSILIIGWSYFQLSSRGML